MPDQLPTASVVTASSQRRIFILFGIFVALAMLATGFNIYHELELSSNRIGANMLIKENQVYITRVNPGEPLFQAGVKSNSYIVSVNNTPVHNFIQLDAELNTIESTVEIVVFKNGRSSLHELKKGTPPKLQKVFIEALICALFLILAYISIPSRGNRNSTRNLLIILLFLFLGLEYILIPFRGLLNVTTGLTYLITISGILLSAIVGGLTLALELHLLCIIPKPRPWFAQNKSAILALLYSTSVYFIFTLSFTYYDYYPEGTLGTLFSYTAWTLIDILWISLILVILGIQFSGAKSSRDKNQLLIIFASMLPFIISISLFEWNFLNGIPEPKWLTSLETFASFSFPIGFMIAVKRYDLADLGQDIQRPLVFKFVSALIVFYLLNSLYSYIFDLGSFDITRVIYFGFGSLLIGMSWFPLSRLLNNWTSSPWHGDIEVSAPTLNKTLDKILAYSKNDKLAENLPRLLNASLHTNWSAILLMDKNRNLSFNFQQNTEENFPGDQVKKQMSSLFYERGALDDSSQSSDSTSLFDLGATNILPLLYHNEMLGIIVLAQSFEHFNISHKALNNFADKLAGIIFTNKMRRLATIDGLTNVLRREAILENLHNELSIHCNSEEEVSICLIDLDHFKQVNDTHGHTAGDTALEHIAKLITKKIRNNDLIGRYGGEEFLIILPKTKVEDAKILLESLRHFIYSSPIQISDDITLKISLSMGLISFIGKKGAHCNINDQQIQDLIHKADIALYQAKQTGRNKVVIAHDT